MEETQKEIARRLILSGLSPKKVAIEAGVNVGTVYGWKFEMKKAGELKGLKKAPKTDAKEEVSGGGASKPAAGGGIEAAIGALREELASIDRRRDALTAAIETIEGLEHEPELPKSLR